MIDFLVTVIPIGYFIAYIMEAKHDSAQGDQLRSALKFSRHMKPYLEDKKPALDFESEMIEASDSWHKWDFIKQAFLAIMWSITIAVLLNDGIYIILAPLIGFERMLIFNIALNFFSGNKDKLHLGSGFFDKFLKNTFGRLWPMAMITLIGACISLIIWIQIPLNLNTHV